MVVERRRHPRYPLVLAVNWPDGGKVSDHTEDLCAGGLFIRTDRKFSEGQHVPLELSFPGLLERLKLTVKVVRLREPGPDGPPGIGVAVACPPAEAEPLGALARAAAQAGHGGRPYRILLVEDNALVATMYASALKRLSSREGMSGMQVEIAHDGGGALARLRAAPSIDLVITDVYMPVMDGLKLLESIRADEALARLPVIVISSGVADEDRRAAQLGAQFFLRKPVKYQDIVATVRTLLAASSQGELGAAAPPGPAGGKPGST